MAALLAHAGIDEALAGHTFAEFFEAWELYEPGILAGVLLGTTLGLVGVYVILRRLIFLSAAVGQMASLGVVLALFMASSASLSVWAPSPMIGALVMAFAATYLVLTRRERASVARDGLLGGLFLAGSAGTILVGAQITHEMHAIEAVLHGVGVAVLPEDLKMAAWLCGAVVLAHVFGWRAFSAVSFDPLGAAVRGLPTRLIEFVLALSLALAIAAGIRALGALPVFALSVLPPLAAVRLASSMPQALALGAIFGASVGFAGYIFSFFYDLPVGASQTFVALVLALGAEVVRRLFLKRA